MSGKSALSAVLAAVLAVAAARADEGAYLTLLSMGRAAATDRGPDPGPLPAAQAPPRPQERRASAPSVVRAAGSAADSARLGGDGAPPVLVSPESGPEAVDARVPSPDASSRGRWARMIAALAPSRRDAPSFAPPDVSTGTARPRAAAADADAAARAGARRGLSELFSAASAAAAP